VKSPGLHAATTELVPKPGLLLSRPPSTSSGKSEQQDKEHQRGTFGVGKTVAPCGKRKSRIRLMRRLRDGPYDGSALLQRHRAEHSSPSFIEGLRRPDGNCTKESCSSSASSHFIDEYLSPGHGQYLLERSRWLMRLCGTRVLPLPLRHQLGLSGG